MNESDAPRGDAGKAPARLTRRADFLRAGRGKRFHGKAFTLQVASRADEPQAPPRIGLTLTRKVGVAVVRNRIRRRLREALRLAPDLETRPGHDYVLVARIEALGLPFAELGSELQRALKNAHAPGARQKPRDRRS